MIHEKGSTHQDLALIVSACAIKEQVLWTTVVTVLPHIPKVIEVNSVKL